MIFSLNKLENSFGNLLAILVVGSRHLLRYVLQYYILTYAKKIFKMIQSNSLKLLRKNSREHHLKHSRAHFKMPKICSARSQIATQPEVKFR